ncbi:MAG TPA: hypothetical protein VFD36_20655 [Kofleriaceae bacterium]|nr:hypothetical protein [Kofleriaceae bacterium]
MQRLRWLISRPFFLLDLVVYHLGWGINTVGNGLTWLARSIRRHVWYPLIVTTRWVQGTPLWQPVDLTIGVQPESERARKTALEAGLVEVSMCGDPTCDNPECGGKRGFVPAAAIEYQKRFTRAFNTAERPPEIEDVIPETDGGVTIRVKPEIEQKHVGIE